MSQLSDPSKWNAKIHKLCNNNGMNQTVIGRLELTTTNKNYNFKTLLIPVIDRSGSMAGNPTIQVKYSLNRIVDLIYSNKQIITNLVVYDDMYDIIELNTNVPIEQSHQTINTMNCYGSGTAFGAAFTGIIKILEKHKANPEISSVVIIFLTDGEDVIPKEKRVNSVKNFKTKLERVWNKKYVVHSVGFGAAHDANFLNALRQIGTAEGAYRYADPTEDNDILSGKINSLLDVIGQSSSIPLKLESNIPVISGENDKYWLNLQGIKLLNPLEFKLTIGDEEPMTIKAEYAEDENDSKIWELWYTYLVDEIASELLLLSNQKENTLDKQIHCELLEQRSRAILTKLDGTSPNAKRLETLMETLKTIRTGGEVNQLKLNDLKYEGIYATKTSGVAPSTITAPAHRPYAVTSLAPIKKKIWEIIEKKKVRRCNAKDDSKEFLKVLGKYNSKDACDWILKNTDKIVNDVDQNGSNMLIVASMIGRCKPVKTLLETKLFDINKTNNEGYNALDLAIIYGYWHTTEILFENGAKPSQEGEKLLRTCMSHLFFNTGSFILKNKFTIVTDEMIENAPTNDVITWLSARSAKEIPIEMAILKGMADVVEEKINTIEKIGWKPYLNIFSDPKPDHYRIVELLLQNNKVDPDEQIEIMDEEEKGWTWPLFNAVEKGQLSMFKLLIKYTKQSIDRQNHKGTTLLWIASCNRHIDIVAELLNMKADPNVPNLKGDGPLVTACQKGNDSIVDLLLSCGARLDVYNHNRDGPVLITCRTGQSNILKKLLTILKPDELKVVLKTYAEIDQFIPLIAATELDKIECIKVCHKFGSDLETRIPEDNKMIPGGTALHLACFYGRVSATRTLIELGANLKSQTTIHKHTPLHLAIKNNHINTVRYLLTLPNIKECMGMEDSSGRIPLYYASMTGNEQMLEEFFTNKLSIYMGRLLHTTLEMEQRCADTLVRYGQSLGVYEYDEITKININNGSTILSYALLNGNHHLVTSLQQMNADFTKVDDYGLSPQFWATFLGYKILGLKPNMKVMDMIDKVRNVSTKSMQNKMLTNLERKNIKNIEYHPVMNTLMKMSDGYDVQIKNDVVTTLRNNKSNDYSLLGFIDKLESSTEEFPEGKDILSYLIWDAKVNIVKRIATNETVLEPIHLLAIYLYTGNPYIFKQINQTLLNWNTNTAWQPFTGCLYQAISMIDIYEGEVYRNVDTIFNLENYAIDNKISWNTFSIASYEWKSSSELINLKRGIVFIIKNKTGRDISKYSQNPVDCEIMFLPGVEFLITNYYSPSMICLAQKNIRNTTFKISEKDIEKAINQQASIIIELEEIDSTNKPMVTVEEL